MRDARSFMAAYGETHARFDADGALSFYRMPLSIVTRQRGWTVADAEEMRLELAQMFDFYRYNGVARVDMEDLRLDREEAAVALAMLVWRAVDASGRDVARFEMTYALGLHEGDRLITGMILHNETFPRDALSAEALAALRSRP